MVARPVVRAALAALASLVVVVAAGCSSDPSQTIETPMPAPTERAACTPVFEQLPTTLGGQSGLVNRQSLVAYWGKSDPIVVRCGVPTPTAMNQTSRCDVINGIGWFAETAKSGGYRFTTIGRAANVEVTVPSKYAPEADVLIDLSEAVKKLPEVKPCA